MNPEVKALWTGALRSGEYIQGVHGLHLGNPDGTARFCCLGVLCKLAVDAEVIPEPVRLVNSDPETPFEFRYGALGAVSYLPFEVMEWAGVNGPDGAFHDGPVSSSLARLNDTGSSFTEIADLIEECF